MDAAVKRYMEGYREEIQKLFSELRHLVLQSVSCDMGIDEKLWAKLPSYYNGNRFIRIIPFKDHINVQAAAIMDYRAELKGFKTTPTGMLQIYPHQNIPGDVLRAAFRQTLLG